MSQQQHSSQHLAPHSSSPTYASYASSISSAPGSRPASPAPMNAGSTTTVPTPPQSPTSYQLKTFASSAPPSPPLSTVIAIGTPGSQPPASSYFPNTPPPPSPSISIFGLLSQPVTRIVVALTILMSLVALGGKFPEHCTAPSHVLYAGEYLSLLASPFVIPLKPALLDAAQVGLVSSIALAITNTLSLALFEDHLTAIFNGNGSRVFRNLFLAMMGLIMGLRQLLGFIFSRSTGWQFPNLFFSDTMFECNLGLSPYLFALLIIQSLFPASREKSVSSWNLRRTHTQLVLCLLNVVPKATVWWGSSGVIVGFAAATLIVYQRRMGRWGGKVKTSAFEKQLWETEVFEAMLEEDDEFTDSTTTGEGPQSKEKKNSTTPWKTLAYILPTFFFVALVLFGSNQLHTLRTDVPNDVLNNSIEPDKDYLLTLVLMTAPRKRGTTYIKETLSSYLANFPDEETDPLYSRIQIVVFTHFTDFPGYDDARDYFDRIPKARKHVKWVREEGSEKNQRKHLVNAIRKVGTVEDSTYLGLMEDDFPFCEGGWQEMLNTIYTANQKVKDHCGVFVGTGGSGLIFKQSVALTASFILENDMQTQALGLQTPPPDISLQDCMLGEHELCSSCAGTMVTSRTLLQGHLGYNSSTSSDDGYDKSQFQCGWRQPFNGLPYVHTF
ncbi:hypothetical protein BG011_000626 [Mortierella polycephala]|uniref:Uncharacterized protein n=1 Tax=Mortierella polycephala TaxID=41804 RepID=A0A9P6TV84_9FUNG|nr:hypothetical protein BG011_000626 [Mortierella polycephala]